MRSSFTRTLGRLDSDATGPRPMAIVGVGLLLAAWATWFFASRVVLYAVSSSARLEVEAPPYRVEAPVSGRVVSVALTMGRVVSAGEVLVELDVRAQDLSAREEQARIEGAGRQIARMEAELAEERNSRRAEEAVALVAQQEAQARHDEAAAASDFAANAEQRTSVLAREGLTGQAELIRVQSEAKQKRAAAEALRLTVARLAAEQRHRETAHRIVVERLEGEIAALRAQAQVSAVTLKRLRHEGALRQIVAPVSGTLAEVATLAAGHVLQSGEAVATIVPAGALRLVAGFAPAELFGRVREGQPARLRLDGFPAAQFGTIPAVVSRAAREVRDGLVRVELTLSPSAITSVPMQHGTPGTVEIEIERISPAALVLRAVGRRMSQPSQSHWP